MKTLRLTFGLLLLTVLGEHHSLAQTPALMIRNPWQVDTLIVVQNSQYAYRFPDNHFPILSTLQITLNRRPLNETLDYRVEDNHLITFFRTFNPNDSLRIRYQRRPFDFPKEFQFYRADTARVKSAEDSLAKMEKGVRIKTVHLENPFAHIPSTLQTSGSIMRGIKVGSNQDFTLNSGLNVQLSGKLSDDIEIIAALTDAATPIQPEGNTQTLSEIDKVFVQFKSPYVQGTVGDFNMDYKGSAFANVQRKLQGITLQTSVKKNTFGATVATTRGFFNHVSFLGQEGNQGPYQLTGKNGERDIIVLAGTERVFINGQRMVRGESNDYVIEYGNGQIRFTNHRLITGNSRIEVDFEYYPAVQSYNRNVYSAYSAHQFHNNELRLNVRYYREQDNTGQVLEESRALTAKEKELLKQAGDDPFKAAEPGFTFKGDSLGSYVKVDTVYQGKVYSIFKFKGKHQGAYTVSFSYFGQHRGDYVRDRLGVYRWVGPKKGDYLPIRLISLPSRHDLVDLNLSGHPWKPFTLKAEYAFTNFDQNTFSSLDDNDNKGQAFLFSGELKPLDLHLVGSQLGKFDMQFKTRMIQKTFRSADRFRKPDFARYWNLYSSPDQGAQELSFQITANYQPVKAIRISNNAGQFRQKDFTSKRFGVNVVADNFHRFSSLAKYEYIAADNAQQSLTDQWKRYRFEIRRKFWKLQPNFSYHGEWRKRTLQQGVNGFRFDDFGLGVDLWNFKHFKSALSARQRKDYVYDIRQVGKLLPQAESKTYEWKFGLKNIRSTTFNLTFMHRNKDYTKYFERIKVDSLKLFYVDAAVQDTSWRDRSTNLAQIDATHHAFNNAIDLSWQYRLSTEETALREKVYVDVGEGRGNLRYDPYLKEYVPDPLGKYILYILPTGKFEPVSNVQTAFRFRFDPYRYTRRKRRLRNHWLSKFSGETYVRIEEESRDPNKTAVYLLNPDHLQHQYTVRGVMNLYQDLFYMKHNRNLSFRLRFRLNRNYNNQFVNSTENDRRKSRELGLRMDWRPLMRLRSQSEGRYRIFVRNSAANALRNRDISGYYFSQNFSYRPKSVWEIGLESESGYETNTNPLYPINLYFVLLRQRLNYSLPGKGRISGQYELQNVTVTKNPFNRIVPFEMAKGKRQGFSQQWQLRVEYTVAKNIVFTFSYIGRKDAGFRRIIHSGQAQLRAFL